MISQLKTRLLKIVEYNTYRLKAIFKPSNSKIFLARIGITLFIDGLRKAFAYKVHILFLQKSNFNYKTLV